MLHVTILMFKLLKGTNHNGFPVVDTKDNTFRGFITRNQLLILLERRQYSSDSIPGNELSVSPNHLCLSFDISGLLDFEYYTVLMNHKWKLSQVEKHLPPPEVQKDLSLDVTRCNPNPKLF